MKLKKEQTLGIIRHLLTALGTVGIALNIVEPEETETIIHNVELVGGVLFTLGSIFWSVKSPDKRIGKGY